MRSWRGVRGGTPVHGKSLCDSCANAIIVKGAAESQRLVTCEALGGHRGGLRVPFEFVVECTDYRERNRVSLSDMEQMAYILQTDKRGKPMGFKPASQFRKDNDISENENLTPGVWG